MGAELLITVVKAGVVLFLVFNLAALLGLIERKGSALIQNRIGANRANFFGVMPFNFGILNTLVADPLKFLTKEDFVPAGGDRFLHWLAPLVAVVPVLAIFAVVPFGDVLVVAGREISLQVADLDVGLLYLLAMTSMSIYGVVLAGWSSNNTWSLLGGIRGAAQMISYEIGMGLSLAAVVMTYDTLDLQQMVRAQGAALSSVVPFAEPLLRWIPAWGIFLQPFAFLVLFTTGIAESKRIPFDLPEGESELVSGYFTEYSGGKHLAFFLGDFIEVIVAAALVTTFFLGGWQIPFLGREGFVFPGGTSIPLPHLAVVLLQFHAFLFKVVFLCWLQIVIRWTLPRFRYDQLMSLGWKGILPLSLVNVVLTAFVVLWVS